jgi:signal transduction histidine kinase
MLGRQQIAGIPTAISELFKNAHDAYAEHAIVDFFRSDSLFVLRDDGTGMTEDDFEQRWLTLGTESKASSKSGLEPPPKRDGYPVRAVLGEKGIGRLAIAAIGPQMLMLSRPLRGVELGDLLVAYVNWSLFELPAANLEDIEIPTVTVAGGTLPDASAVDTLVGWADENLHRIALPTDRALTRRIGAELKAFRGLDPKELAEVLGTPSLLDGPGTHFYIRPSSELLAEELDNKDGREATPLRRMLVGFANTMTPGHRTPAVLTAFRDHYTEDAFEDVISEAEFFTPQEFEAADHHIRGDFDQFGQFSGTVSVYGRESQEYAVAWPSARGSKVRCGPFHLNLAYVQGAQRDSRLPPDTFVEVSSKLNRYGGLYIYRDDIRVLPYGNSDFDFLDIELRRAKSASDAFFSHRRMFGVIELSRRRNSELREKAGREGFADNEAYRQFREILKNFLYQVAVDFFRESGPRSDVFRSERSELNRLDKARLARGRQTRIRRKQLSDGLDDFFARTESAVPQQEVADVLIRLEGQVASALQRNNPSEAADDLIAAERTARSQVQALVASYDVSRPRGVGLTKPQSRLWMSYENERARLAEEIFAPAMQDIEAIVSSAFAEADVVADRRVRFDEAIGEATERTRESVRVARRELDRTSRDARTNAQELARAHTAAVDALLQDVLARAARLDVISLDDDHFVGNRSAFEIELAEAARTHTHTLASMSAQLDALVWPSGSNGDEGSYLDQVEALETDLEALRDQTERDLELAQLGAAIEVINHEFDGTINSIRRSLRRFKSWADENPGLREPYQDLRASFEHLDGYLKLFTPLHRRLYRTKVEIVGSEIEKFLRDVFERRLSGADVRLEATDAFAQLRIMQYPSVVYPVLVNLVDNAIYWLTDYRGSRIVTLDAKDGAMIVRDTGPGIAARDHEAIFEFGFSRKPGGTGYGLYISREVLHREGWSLALGPSKADVGAEFVLSPVHADG